MKKIICLILLILILVTSCSDFTSKNQGKVYIISVGLDYEGKGVSVLRTCPKDAYDMAKVLSNAYAKKGIDCSVQTLIKLTPSTEKTSSAPAYLTNLPETNKEPTKGNILGAINTLNPNPEDLIIFYFSGHGDLNPVDNSFKDEENDTEARKGKSFFYDQELTGHVYVEEILNALKAKKCNCAVIVDVCHSGASYEEDDNGFSQAIKSLFEKQEFSHIGYLASSRQDESSYVSNNTYANNSNYTKVLLNIIRSSDSLSLRELYRISNSRFRSEHPDHYYSDIYPQHPELSFNNLDLFIIP